jgi:Putative Flp pilus-assembly TadE/G-like
MSAHRDRDRGRRARARYRDQSGNILVMFAILLPIFMIGGAVVVDVGYWWANARKAQIAADACALAAARDLPKTAPSPTGGGTWDLSHCRFGAPERDYVLTNLPAQGPDTEPVHASTRVVWPYQGDLTLVEATVNMKVRTFFGRYVGLGGVELTRRAVAEQSIGVGDYAIYAHSPSCGKGLRFNSLNQHIEGLVHSNGEYKVNGEGFWASEGTHNGGTCDPDVSSDTSFGSPPTPGEPVDKGFQPWPAWWTPLDFGWSHNLDATDTCDVVGQTILFKDNGSGTRIEVKELDGDTVFIDSSGSALPTGRTYCASEKITLARPNMSGAVTVLSPEIEVTASGQDLRAHELGVLFFIVPNNSSTDDGSVPPPDGRVPAICQPKPADAKLNTINNGPLRFRGVVFAPCTRVKIDAEHTTFTDGAILAYEVEVNDKYFRMEGNSGIGSTVTLALDQ